MRPLNSELQQSFYEQLDERLLQIALDEDLGFSRQDATTNLLFPASSQKYQARIISKHPEPIVICGIGWAQQISEKFAADSSITSAFQDGDRLEPGQTLLTITAPANAILSSERIILNFLRHLCAIATLTAKYVDRVKHTDMKILDTRKTTPGLRHLEKYAVYCGGGVNHRMGLYDAIMIKDTHVDLLGGMQAALAQLSPLNSHELPVIVEVRSPQELAVVLEYGRDKVSQVLLDNMSLDILRACVADCRGLFMTEASGNLRLDTIAAVAETGVNYASVGELTYNAGQVDLSMYGITI